MKGIKNFISSDKYTIIGHIIFIILIILAAIYDMERTFIVDNSWQLSSMINDKNCYISFGRHSMAIADILPLILIWFGVPLKFVVLGYSVSFILLGYVIFIIAVHILKDKIAGIVITSATLMECHIFFFAVAETVQMIYFCTLLIAWLRFTPKTNKILPNIFYYIALIAITYFCVYIHPSAIFPIAFIICYNLVDNGLKIDKKTIVCAITFVILEIIRSFSYTNEYESKYFDFDTAMASTLNFFNLDLFHGFINHTFIETPLLNIAPLLLFITCVIFYVKKKLWLKLLFITCANTAFVFVDILIYSAVGYSFGTYERIFISIIIFTMLPFANDVLPCLNSKQEKIFAYIFSIFLLFSFIGITQASKVYTKRLQEIEKVIHVAQTENKHKIFIKPSLVTEKLCVWSDYDLPFVSCMLSALDGPENTITLYMHAYICFENPTHGYKPDGISYMYNHIEGDLIITDFGDTIRGYDTNKLNPNYFHLPEEKYCEIKYQNGKYYIE